jgi:L-threonylcarbamoyladenylate synthase
VTARLVEDGPAGRTEAVEVLRSGGIVGLPTDTVYGIAVDLASPGGIERLFAAKRRPPERGIVLLLSEAGQATTIGELGPAGQALATACWPGALTLIVRQARGAVLPAVLTGGAPTIGLRVPDHAAPRALASRLGPLPTTSANLSGRPDALAGEAVIAELGDAVDLVLDGGPAPGGRPSTVVDVTVMPPRILRAGAIPASRISEVLATIGMELGAPGGGGG